MSENKKKNEIAHQVSDTLMQTVFGFIPGGHAIEAFVNFSANLKQTRILNFMESFKTHLDSLLEEELKLEDITNEEFVDVLELILNKVQSTKSAYKLEKLRTILAKQIIAPSDAQESVNYINIVNQLEEIELILLHKVHEEPEFRLLLQYLPSKAILSEEGKETHLKIRMGTETIEIEYSDANYHVHKLVSMGLLLRREHTSFSLSGKKSVRNRKNEFISLSPIGERLILYINQVGS